MRYIRFEQSAEEWNRGTHGLLPSFYCEHVVEQGNGGSEKAIKQAAVAAVQPF